MSCIHYVAQCNSSCYLITRKKAFRHGGPGIAKSQKKLHQHDVNEKSVLNMKMMLLKNPKSKIIPTV